MGTVNAAWFTRGGAGLIALLASGCGCQEVGCLEQITGETELQASTSERVRLRLIACRNNHCSTAVIDSEALNGPGGNVASARLVGAIDATAHLTAFTTDGRWQFRIVLNPDDEAGDFSDGDVVTLDARDEATGETVFFVQQKMTYATSAPNGALCGPSCEWARLELASS